MSTKTVFSLRAFFPRFCAGLMLVVCLIVGLCISPPALAHVASLNDTPPPNVFKQHLLAQLEAKMKAMQVPGAVIFVQSARTGGAWTNALGISDLATQTPINADLHFRIGSITKTFTGTVILQLADEGKLRLDDPVAKYQPEVPNGAHITIRELLNMTSGLYNYSEDADFQQEYIQQPEKVWTPQELLAISFKHPAYFAPGQNIHYSNTNFILLGLMIEQVTKHPAEFEFQQRIFAPLGMNDTLLPARTSFALPTPYAHGYAFPDTLGLPAGKLLDVTSWNPSWGWTAGAAISTLHDLRIWARALATGTLLSAAMQRQRLTWVPFTGSIPLWSSSRYGLAIASFDQLIGHNGDLPGYQSFEGYTPASGDTVVVLTNLYTALDGTGPADALASIIAQDLAS